jgi:hypothetical protein
MRHFRHTRPNRSAPTRNAGIRWHRLPLLEPIPGPAGERTDEVPRTHRPSGTVRRVPSHSERRWRPAIGSRTDSRLRVYWMITQTRWSVRGQSPVSKQRPTGPVGIGSTILWAGSLAPVSVARPSRTLHDASAWFRGVSQDTAPIHRARPRASAQTTTPGICLKSAEIR